MTCEPTASDSPGERERETYGALRERPQQATKRRITETAGRRFKRDGLDGSGISTLMADAGLTNGAFFAHFASKDDLVAATFADQLRTQHENICEQPAPGRAGLERIERAYVSAWHRDAPDDGCPSAALLDEIGRSKDATRQTYTDGILLLADEIATRRPALGAHEGTRLLAQLAGTLQLSRALADRHPSDQLLEQGIHDALTLIGSEWNG